ncbi:hypothetical protein NDI49_13670 [Trichocoleus sp. ST-U3]
MTTTTLNRTTTQLLMHPLPTPDSIAYSSPDVGLQVVPNTNCDPSTRTAKT